MSFYIGYLIFSDAYFSLTWNISSLSCSWSSRGRRSGIV